MRVRACSCALFFPTRIALIFGAVTVLSGILGVVVGMTLSNRLRPIFPRVDPLICGAGLLGSSVLLILVFTVSFRNGYLCFMLIFLAETLIGLNWSVANDITLVRKFSSQNTPVLFSFYVNGVGLWFSYFSDISERNNDCLTSSISQGAQ